MEGIEDEELIDILDSLEHDAGVRIVDSNARTLFINKGIDGKYVVMLKDLNDVIYLNDIEKVIQIIKEHLIKPYNLYLY